MEESSYSSFYSSFLKTDSSSNGKDDGEKNGKNYNSDEMQWDKMSNQRRSRPWCRPDPPWLNNVNVTPDLIYRYQITAKTIAEVLQADNCELKKINQVIFFFCY